MSGLRRMRPTARRQHVRSCLAALLMTAAAGTAWSQQPNQAGRLGLSMPAPDESASLDAMLAAFERTPDFAVAAVGTAKITWGDIADSIRAMPRIVGGVPLKFLYENAALQVMRRKALVRLAEKTGLDQEPAVQRHMRNAAEETLASEMLRRSLAPNVTTDALRKVYDEVVANRPGPEEVRTSIIMVTSEEQANALIDQLRKGADFGTLARDFSIDGTAAQGGDLGYARREMLAPEIAAVAFALGLGQVTAYPVKSGNFWFIVKAGGRTRGAAPEFEQVRAALTQDVIHAGIPGLGDTALREAPVTIYGQHGQGQTEQAGN